MNVYFVNCFLAVTLAFWAGYALASRTWQKRIVGMFSMRPASGPKDTNLR